MVAEEDFTVAQEVSTAAEAPMPLVEHATAATMAVDTMVGTEATTGMSGIGATLVTVLIDTVTDGDSALASAGGGHTRILMATVTVHGGMVPTITRIIIPTMHPTETHTLTTATTLPHQVRAPSPAITPQ
jgi:hypothetical protein